MDTGNDKTKNGPSTQSDDYLWDGSGEPDPEIQKLEGLLGKFRHDSPAPVFPEIARRPAMGIFFMGYSLGECSCSPAWPQQPRPLQRSLS